MLNYKYTARNPTTGEKVTSAVQADGEKAAVRLIKDQGYVPTEVKLISETSNPLAKWLNKVKTKDRVIFSRQLATMINAGLPLIQTLRTVSSQTQSKKLKMVIGEVINDVEGGASFEKALSKYPEVFSNVYISMVGAGEASGTLDQSLERLANQQEKDAEIISKVKGAMVYPFIVLLVMIGVSTFMIVAVLPQVKLMYDGIKGATLPLLTRVLLSISDFTRHFWWVELIAVGVAFFFSSRWANSGPGKVVMDRVKMHVWPIGPLFMKLYMARFSRTASTLVASGVPLLQTLSITAEAVDNTHVARSINIAAEKVKGGKSLSEVLKGDPNFLDLVPDMIHIGETSGTLDDMLSKAADYYEKEVDNQIRTVSTIIEPVMMILMGVMAMTIVAAILLPIYGLVGKSFIH